MIGLAGWAVAGGCPLIWSNNSTLARVRPESPPRFPSISPFWSVWRWVASWRTAGAAPMSEVASMWRCIGMAASAPGIFLAAHSGWLRPRPLSGVMIFGSRAFLHGLQHHADPLPRGGSALSRHRIWRPELCSPTSLAASPSMRAAGCGTRTSTCGTSLNWAASACWPARCSCLCQAHDGQVRHRFRPQIFDSMSSLPIAAPLAQDIRPLPSAWLIVGSALGRRLPELSRPHHAHHDARLHQGGDPHGRR